MVPLSQLRGGKALSGYIYYIKITDFGINASKNNQTHFKSSAKPLFTFTIA